MQSEDQPLPCRGCTADCKHYPECDGRPWRIGEQLGQSLRWAGLRASGSSDRNVGVSRAP